MNALRFLVETLLSLVFFVVLLRLLLQLVRADFRNQLAVAVVRLTNWLVMPLRRVLPPVGRVDTASVLAVIIVAAAMVGIVSLLRSGSWPSPVFWVTGTALEIVRTTLIAYFWMIFAYALIGMISPGTYSPVGALLASLCEPVLQPIRRLIPPIAGLDLSPLWAGIAIQMLLILLPS